MTRKCLTPKERYAMLIEQEFSCLLCGGGIVLEDCIAEHWTPVALGNDQKPDCLLCKPCANRKTNGAKATTYGSDKHAIAKVKRLRGETKQGPKRKLKSRGFDKTRRRKMDGTVERIEAEGME